MSLSAMPSVLVTGAFDAESTGSHVDYRLLVPADLRPGERLPLILHLHGAMSSAASLDAAKPAYDAAWAAGDLPRAVVACASTPTLGGFYLDWPNGPGWASLVGDELPRFVAGEVGPATARALIGFSMGGFGALRLAFGQPEAYVAVAALCPAIFPGETPDAVPERNRPSVLGDLHRALGDDPATYAANSVHGPLRANAARIRDHGPCIFLDCGDADEFGLHDGAAYLHAVLDDLAIPHRFASVAGAGHADAAAATRQATAIRVLGRALAEAS